MRKIKCKRRKIFLLKVKRCRVTDGVIIGKLNKRRVVHRLNEESTIIASHTLRQYITDGKNMILIFRWAKRSSVGFVIVGRCLIGTLSRAPSVFFHSFKLVIFVVARLLLNAYRQDRHSITPRRLPVCYSAVIVARFVPLSSTASTQKSIKILAYLF